MSTYREATLSEDRKAVLSGLGGVYQIADQIQLCFLDLVADPQGKPLDWWKQEFKRRLERARADERPGPKFALDLGLYRADEDPPPGARLSTLGGVESKAKAKEQDG